LIAAPGTPNTLPTPSLRSTAAAASIALIRVMLTSIGMVEIGSMKAG
jgi:hypothetical protein